MFHESHIILLVDLNEFSSIFWIVHLTPDIRKQPHTSLESFKRNIMVQQMTTRGSYVHEPKVKFSGASQKCYFLQISQNIDGFRKNDSQGF